MRSYAIRATPHNCSRITTVETICIPTMQAAAPRGMRFLSHCSKAIKLDSTDAEGRLTLGVRPAFRVTGNPSITGLGKWLARDRSRNRRLESNPWQLLATRRDVYV